MRYKFIQSRLIKLNPEYVIHFKGRNFFEMISEKKDMSDDEFGKINKDKTVYRWIKDVTPYKSGIYFAFNYDKTYFVKHENRMTENIYTIGWKVCLILMWQQ